MPEDSLTFTIPYRNITRSAYTGAAAPNGPGEIHVGDIVTVGNRKTQWKVIEAGRHRLSLRNLKWRFRWCARENAIRVYDSASIENF